MEPKFIIWDPLDGSPRRDEEGVIISDGLIGRVGPDNVYIKVYACYKVEPARDLNNCIQLEVGQHVEARFTLSGSRGDYQVWRVA